MIEATATVMRAEGALAWVLARPRASACGHCSARSGCVSATFGGLIPSAPAPLLEVDNRLCAQAGEQVVIGIPDAVLIHASLLAYLMPLLAMIGAVGLVAGAGFGDGARALAALTGLGAGLLATGSLSRRARTRYRPSVLRRASPFFSIAELGTDRGDSHE